MGTALVSIAFGLTASLFATGASAQATLNSVKQKGFLTCGSNTGLAGFGQPDAQGNWTGLDVDFCRAIAAAIFDDPTKVRFIPLAAKDRFTALQSGEVDVLARNSTATMSRETQLGLDFPAINYYDGQGFMVRKKLGVASAKELNGASICTQQGTTTELNLADYFRANNMKYEVVAFATSDETFKAYDAGRCDAFTTDASGLYAVRLRASAPGRSYRAARDHLQGAARPGSPPWRQPVGRYRPLDSHGHAERRRARCDQGQCRSDEDLRQPGDQASSRHGRQVRRGHRPDQRLGCAHHQACGQLRRVLRAERRRRLASEDQARSERPVDQGRPAIRHPGPLMKEDLRNARRVR